ncbi:MAG: DUF4115 domain-containing protein [Colwellia sp.]
MTNDLLTPIGSDKNIKVQQEELSEKVEFVGPGSLLSKARKSLGLTTEEITKKLNLKTNLVDEIENDIFDQTLPTTFNRGYLRNYAKVVNIDIEEVLAAYDRLDIAKEQHSQMQSFSNLTEKKAEHSRLMWLSYLIAGVLFSLMVLWWLQAPSNDDTLAEADVITTKITNSVALEDKSISNSLPENRPVEPQQSTLKSSVPQSNTEQANKEQKEILIPDKVKSERVIAPVIPTIIGTAVFTFSGDCWVKIYDATGERVAWGVKKSGYVMTINAKQPFKVTLGKPKLVSIVLNGKLVDMSSIDMNNIASFTLPIELK